MSSLKSSAAFLSLLFLAAAASAADFVVTNTDDSGPGSLRQAILDSNVNRQPDTITFDSIVFNVPRTITLTSGYLEVGIDNTTFVPMGVTIAGPGADLLTISGNRQSSVIHIAYYARAEISGVTIADGRGTHSDYVGSGGGILIYPGNLDGGVKSLVLKDSVVTRCESSWGGGGIFTAAPTLILNSAVYGNSSSDGNGGGISISGNYSRVEIINSTVASNRAIGVGGISINNGSDVSLINSTVANNFATTQQVASGVGIYVGQGFYYPKPLKLRNTIVAHNTAATMSAEPDILASIESAGNNLLGTYTPAWMQNVPGPGDIIGIDAEIDSEITSNGGVIPTVALSGGSPAIDAGNSCVLLAAASGGCLDDPISFDPRGTARPQDGNGDGAAQVDIGAFEASASEILLVPPVPDLDAASDSGLSDSDDVTMGRRLTFTAAGIASGATVQVFRNNTLIETIVASSDTMTFVDENLPADGVFKYRIRQTADGVRSQHSASRVVTIDNTAPGILINQAAGQTDPVRTQPIRFTALPTELVTGLDQTDISLIGSTADLATAQVSMLQNSIYYNIEIGGVASDGRVTASFAASGFQDLAGNLNVASTSSDNSVTLDTTAPVVTINRAATQAASTRHTPVNFTLTFSEPVTGLNTSDVSLAGSTANVSNAGIHITGSGMVYNVAVSSFASNGGTITASMLAAAVTDAAGNLSVASIANDNTVVIDNVAPTATINQAAVQADPTNQSPINYSVVFSEPVTGFDASDILLSGTAIGGFYRSPKVTGSGTTYNVEVGDLTSNGGVLVAQLRSGAAADSFGNTSFNLASTDSAVKIDNVAPSVIVTQSTLQADPATITPVAFLALFNENVVGFSAADVSLAGSTADISQAQIFVAPLTSFSYRVEVSNIPTGGTVVVSVPAGGASDLYQNGNTASAGSDNVVTLKYAFAGLVAGPDGLGLRNTVVSIKDAAGITRSTVTDSFGSYELPNLRIGESYKISVLSKRYRFTSRTLQFTTGLSSVDFAGRQ